MLEGNSGPLRRRRFAPVEAWARLVRAAVQTSVAVRSRSRASRLVARPYMGSRGTDNSAGRGRRARATADRRPHTLYGLTAWPPERALSRSSSPATGGNRPASTPVPP